MLSSICLGNERLTWLPTRPDRPDDLLVHATLAEDLSALASVLGALWPFFVIEVVEQGLQQICRDEAHDQHGAG